MITGRNDNKGLEEAGIEENRHWEPSQHLSQPFYICIQTFLEAKEIIPKAQRN